MVDGSSRFGSVSDHNIEKLQKAPFRKQPRSQQNLVEKYLRAVSFIFTVEAKMLLQIELRMREPRHSLFSFNKSIFLQIFHLPRWYIY